MKTITEKCMRSVLLCLGLCLCFSMTVFAKNKAVTIDYEEEGYQDSYTQVLEGVFDLNEVGAGNTYINLSWERSYLDEAYMIDEYGYEVSYYDPDTARYRHIKYLRNLDKNSTTVKYTGTSTTGTALKAGKNYYFAVRTYCKYEGKYYYGYYTKLKCATKPVSTEIKSLTAGSAKITVSWKKVSNCDGYAVLYGTSSGLNLDYGTADIKFYKDAATVSKSFTKLPSGTYYVKVAPYKKAGNGIRVLGKWSERKSVKITEGASLKTMINAINTKDNYHANDILEWTEGDVDIRDYSTTYDKFMAIYHWHALHAQEFVHCLACHENFNICIFYLLGYQDREDYPRIWIDAGNYINSSGSLTEHKWSVIHFGLKPYIFDPRMQGYINKKGSDYFGFTKSSSLYKKHYDYEGHWELFAGYNIYYLYF